MSWNKAQALDTGSAELRPGLCLTDWVSICKVVNLSLFLFFSNNQSYLFEMPLKEIGRPKQNKTKTKPQKWSIENFGLWFFLIYKVLIITPTWQDYCEYERRQSLLHSGRSALAALGWEIWSCPLKAQGPSGITRKKEWEKAPLLLPDTWHNFFFCYPAGKDVFYT